MCAALPTGRHSSPVSWASGIDPQTSRPIENAGIRYDHELGHAPFLFVNQLVGDALDLFHQNLELRRRKDSAVFPGERRHQRLVPSLGENAVQFFLRHDGSKERVIERRRGPQFAVSAVTPGAMLRIQRCEFHDLVGGHRPISGVGPPGKIAPRQERQGDKETRRQGDSNSPPPYPLPHLRFV